jgi:hypothetical protein
MCLLCYLVEVWPLTIVATDAGTDRHTTTTPHPLLDVVEVKVKVRHLVVDATNVGTNCHTTTTHPLLGIVEVKVRHLAMDTTDAGTVRRPF